MHMHENESGGVLIPGVKIIEVDSHLDERGSLSYLEFESMLGFLPKRFFYLSNIAKDAKRGDHAHKECSQFLIALRGSVSIQFDDGLRASTIHLEEGNKGLLVRPMIWAKLSQFSTQALILVLASHNYDEDDYLRDYSQFKALVNA